MGLKPKPYTESLSWAMWDLGKQECFFLHPDQNDPAYLLGDPLVSIEKRHEIVDRHVGWELFPAGQRNDTSLLEHIPEISRSRVMEFLSRTPKKTKRDAFLKGLGRAWQSFPGPGDPLHSVIRKTASVLTFRTARTA
jgi:hypothetical protein